jgi:hypothetical protein
LTSNPDGSIKWIRVHPVWKELYYKFRDLKRTIFHQYEEVEFWECRDCVLAEHGTYIKQASKNPSKRYDEKFKVIEKRDRR